LALYPGGGAAPVIEPYRLATRGFKELAGISHLGPALASLARLRELATDDGGDSGGDGGGWHADAARLLDATKAARAASSMLLWRDQIAVRAFAGREESIAAMIDYSCLQTERFLQRALDDPDYLTMAEVRPHAPVFPPYNPAAADRSAAKAMELGYRRLWAGLRATSDLAGGMFEGYPRFAAAAAQQPAVGPETASVHAKPALKGPDDWLVPARSPTSPSPATRAMSCGPARSTRPAACSAARSGWTCSTTASTPTRPPPTTPG
jgi:hypothetical protein